MVSHSHLPGIFLFLEVNRSAQVGSSVESLVDIVGYLNLLIEFNHSPQFGGETPVGSTLDAGSYARQHDLCGNWKTSNYRATGACNDLPDFWGGGLATFGWITLPFDFCQVLVPAGTPEVACFIGLDNLRTGLFDLELRHRHSLQ